MKKIILLLVVLFNTSCNISLVYEPVTIKELLPVGSVLRLTETLDIPADRLFIYIAHGKVAPLKNYNTVDIYQPYCMFRLHKEDSQARQIVPDQFVVTKVVEWDGYYGSLDYRRADNRNIRRVGFIMKSAMDDDPGLSTVMYATILSLHSARQPEVKELVCGHWDDQGVVEPLTLEEMKSALGDLITIDKADSKIQAGGIVPA